jgi:hypothetical protein
MGVYGLVGSESETVPRSPVTGPRIGLSGLFEGLGLGLGLGLLVRTVEGGLELAGWGLGEADDGWAGAPAGALAAPAGAEGRAVFWSPTWTVLRCVDVLAASCEPLDGCAMARSSC